MTASFLTDTGIEVPAVSAVQMREIDRIAIEETGPNLYQMMENAGRTLASETLDLLGSPWKKAGIVVLAGKGGNGGGGICAARHLANRGARVSLILSSPDSLDEVAKWQRKIFHETPGVEIQLTAYDELRPDIVLDALIGYSLAGPPHGVTAELIRWANAINTPLLALDLPSGVDATTGQVVGDCIVATRTVTLALPKTGLSSQCAGDIALADIGIPYETYRRAGIVFTSPFDRRFRVSLLRG